MTFSPPSRIDNETEWDHALARLPAAHALQSWAWGAFKSRWGWSAERLLWRHDGAPVAAAQILARPLPPTPWRFLYVSKGPALDYSDAALVEQVLTDLEQYAHQRRALFIKIDPDLPRSLGDPTEAEPAPHPPGQETLARLARRGWQFSPEQIQFRNTIVIELSGEPEEWLSRMKSKWRYNIRLAGRRGVEVRREPEAELPRFYQMYAETAARDGFLIRPEGYYLDAWRSFMARNQAELLLAWVEGEAVAGLIPFFFGPRAWYMYGASTNQHRNLMPNHRLQWQAMRRAQAHGCTHYDLWGAPDRFEESDEMWGVYRFKRGFGGEVIHGLGAFDYPARPALYRLFTRFLPQLRALWRRWRGG